MKILGIFLVALFALTGCASTGDVEALQAQVSALESNEKVVFEDILDEKGEYNYKTSLNDLKVIVDAGSGHTVSKKIKLQEQKNEEKTPKPKRTRKAK